MHLLDDFRLDLRYAIRTLRREPLLVLGVVLTFALAIGANAAMVGLVTRLMLSAPTGVQDASRVAHVELEFSGPDRQQYRMSTMSYPAFRAARELSAFSGVAAVRSGKSVVGNGAGAGEVPSIGATGDYFTALGAKPALGRFFGPEDDVLPAGNSVVVLSHAYWRRQFGANPGVLGSKLTIDGDDFTILGVAAPGFSGDALAAVDIFLPLSASMRKQGYDWWNEPDINLISIVARLKEGVSLAAAAGMLTPAIQRRAGENVPRTAQLEPLQPGAASAATPESRIALWLAGVSLVVLLIATANIATLLLLRAERRRHEIAVRLVLGVRRGRLTMQLLLESLVLATLGGAAALLVCGWAEELIRATLLPNLAPAERLLDGRMLIATLVAALAAGVISGLAPLIVAGRASLSGALQSGSARGSTRRSLMQRGLIGVQVALGTVLLIGAGLFMRSLYRVEGQDLGFSPAQRLFMTLDFRNPPAPAERDRIQLDLAQRVAQLPGTDGATVVQAMPFGSFHVPPISVPGHNDFPEIGGQPPFMYGATPTYLRLMGVTLREGRMFTEQDAAGTPLVLLVNETFARVVWPNERAVGHCIRTGFDPSQPPSMLAPTTLPCREVVGVVRDSRARSLRPAGNEAALMQFYVPWGQLSKGPVGAGPQAEVFGILVGTKGDPANMIVPVQRLVQGSSPTPVYARVQPYEDLLDPQLRPWRLGATLFGALAALALVIAAVGVFGVVSYLVVQRTREIGVRVALGATSGGIGRLVVGQALGLVGAGAVVGVIAALAAGSLVQPLLFDTSSRDVPVLLAVCTTLVLVTAMAAALPAWRASRVDPTVALRAE